MSHCGPFETGRPKRYKASSSGKIKLKTLRTALVLFLFIFICYFIIVRRHQRFTIDGFNGPVDLLNQFI